MSIFARARFAVALLLGVAFLAMPAAAHATLAFDVDWYSPFVYVSRGDDGAGAKPAGRGLVVQVSPDGELVAIERQNQFRHPELRLYDVESERLRTILSDWRETAKNFAWSPDSSMMAALKGPERGKRTLYVIDVETGEKTRIASGYFRGVSFSPDSRELVFGRAASGERGAKIDIFRTKVTGGPTKALTRDGVSGRPLWGPRGKIVFVKQSRSKSRRGKPHAENQLFLMNGDGTGVRQLTHTKVGRRSVGLFPVAWSASGDGLLAEYQGFFEAYGVAVDPKTGAETSLSPGDTEQGFVGVALSPDGSTALGYLGGVGGSGAWRTIVSVPFAGGKRTVIRRDAFSPSWGGPSA
jgi:dipeptidyl aminopeptidase/acylaminoacyl peptidase